MRYDNNLAYDYDFAESSLKREQKAKEQLRAKKLKARAQTIKLQKTIGICAVILAICAGFMICRNVAVYEGKNEVASLQKELNGLKEYSSQKAFEIDQSLDIESIEKAAKTKLSMVRPEKYQTVYVNIKQDDMTEVTANEVEGIGGLFGIFKGEDK